MPLSRMTPCSSFLGAAISSLFEPDSCFCQCAPSITCSNDIACASRLIVSDKQSPGRRTTRLCLMAHGLCDHSLLTSFDFHCFRLALYPRENALRLSALAHPQIDPWQRYIGVKKTAPTH